MVRINNEKDMELSKDGALLGALIPIKMFPAILITGICNVF